MKKLIALITVLFVANYLTAQTIDTTFKGSMTAIKIQPFKAAFNDTANVTHLGVRIIGDDLKSSCMLYWCLFAGNNIALNGNIAVNGKDYTAWSGDNMFLFKFVADKLRIKWL